LLAAIFAMHLPVIISLMLMDSIGVTADDTCVRKFAANSSTNRIPWYAPHSWLVLMLYRI
jgi:hypothetical protein